MPSADQNLKIFLQVQADASQLATVNAGLATTAVEAEGAAVATSELGSAFSGAISGAALGGIGLLIGAFSQIPSLIEHAADDQVKWTEEINRQAGVVDREVTSWIKLAKAADSFGDGVKLGDKIAPALASAAALMAKFRSEQLSAWQKFWDAIGFGDTPYADGLKAAQAAATAQLSSTVADANAVITAGNQNIANWKRESAEPVKQALTEVGARLDDLKAKAADLDKQRFAPDPVVAADAIQKLTRINDELANEQGHYDTLAKKQEAEAKAADRAADAATKKHGAQTKAAKDLEDQISALTAKLSGSPEQIADALAQQTYDRKITSLKQEGALTTENVAKAKELRDLTYQEVLAQEQKKNAGAANRTNAEGERLAHQQINAEIKDERLQLEAIKSQISSVGSNPFLNINEKNVALAQLLPQAMKELNLQIDLQRSKIKGGALDPTQVNAARSAIQGAGAEIGKLKIQLQLASSPTKQLQANLTAWVSSFGTTAQQVGQTITSTIGTAVSGVSNAITGAIFQTQSWGQAFAQTAQQIVGNIINIVLQWIEQQAVMLALHAVFGTAAAATSAGVAATTAAVWAPAATAASIATEGEADAVGVAALTSAMAAGQGIVSGVGLFEKGGYNPGMGITHPGEYIIDKTTVARAGGPQAFDNLRVAINNPSSGDRGRDRSGNAGGRSSSASRRNEQPHIYIFTDRDELQRHWQRNSASRKTVIDWVNAAGGNLRS